MSVPTPHSELSHVWPIGSEIDGAGRLRIGGCDAIELAREFGTPAYIVAEDDLRARAQAFVAAFSSRNADCELLFASKAFPCTAVYRVLAEEGIGCDVASGGELVSALRGGFAPERLVLHGNAKSEAELALALREHVGTIVVDGADELERLERQLDGGKAPQRVFLRVTPNVRGETHDGISTGQADSKFGVELADAPALLDRMRGNDRLDLRGVHMHIGSQLRDLTPFRRAVEAVAGLGAFPEIDLGGGLGVAYTSDMDVPSIDDYAAAKVGAVHEHLGSDVRIIDEPGRALVANSCVTLYTVETIKRNVSTWVAVDGGMSDNMRPMLYGARYEAHVADRFGGGTPCHVVGKHCESSDVIVRDAELADPRVGDVVVTPVTGAYGFSMANNYNGIPRPPVVFCRDGDARVVVRRETHDDLFARDV
ncbi:MAG TPA: diaminopimelate decarboxylase [Solirubrobacteraceae bacterium]|nr:diaminopimelate decarboxylase [Solirubrobacteraceae bacterium]